MSILLVDDIKTQYLERYGQEWEDEFNHLKTESGEYVSDYEDYDKIVTDNEFYEAVDTARGLLEYEDCIKYLEDEGLMKDFKEYVLDDIGFEACIKYGTSIKVNADELETLLFDFCCEDIDDYLGWLWSRK